MELLLNLTKWSVITGTAALALTLLKPLLDKRYSAKWRYGVWLVMALFLLLSPVRLETVASQTPVTPPVVIEVPKVEVSVSREDGISIQGPETSKRPAANIPAASPAVKSRTFPLEELLLTLWATGGLLFLLYRALGTWYFTRRAKRWSRSGDEETLRVFSAVCHDMTLKNPPVLRISSTVDSPMMVGLFRPALLLPGEDFDELELAFILRHELTHHRRHDLWYKLILTLANALHWFNPLVYLMRREAERDLELTCDDAVVAGAGADVRRAYSETLLASVHRQKGLSRAVLSTHFYGGKEVMKERFRNILGKRGRKRGILVLAAVLLAVAAAACTFGLQTSADGELTPEELAEWSKKANTSEELGKYLWCMYTDVSQIPSEECIEADSDLQRSYHEPTVRVSGGTRSGDTVTLELEGDFSTGLNTGTLTLKDGEPVSFTHPLYTAAEAAALEEMEEMAEARISESNESGPGGLEFTEKYITSLECIQTVAADEKNYYIFELFYRMKPNALDKIVMAGGMADDQGWLTESQSVGRPIIIASMNEDGSASADELTYTGAVWETGYTWEEYITCHTIIGMDKMTGILNGWPELTMPFLESLRDGHDTWAMDWQDTALSYLSGVYDIYPDNGLAEVEIFTADENGYAHDQAKLVQAKCSDGTVTGNRTVMLLLARVYYPVEVWGTTFQFWQVVGEKWDPDAPETAPSTEPEPGMSGRFQGELTADELATVTSYFNVVSHNSLLRVPYESFDDLRYYQEILLYDLGKPVTDEAERAALEERMNSPIETDCLKLTREDIRAFYDDNFLWTVSEEEMDQMLAEDLSLPNLPEYDAYYFIHGDTMMTNYTFDRGERDENGRVRLYYTTDLWDFDGNSYALIWDQPMCATMTPHPDGGEGWLMISNQIAE